MSKRINLSLSEKYELVQLYKSGESQTSISKRKNIARTTIIGICKNADKIVNDYESGQNSKSKRVRTHNYEDVDKPLLDFFRLAREQNIPISGAMLLEKALVYARQLKHPEPISIDINWVNRWKLRNEVVSKKLHGEASSADLTAADNWVMNRLTQVLNEFQPENIFNCDETGLFYRYVFICL